MTLATLRARLVSAWPALLLAFGLRLLAALPVGATPAAWAASTTRHFPAGERALFDRGGVLLFDVLAHDALPFGATWVAIGLALAVWLMSLVLFGAIVATLGRRLPLANAVGDSVARTGTSLLLVGLSSLALALTLVVELLAFGPIVAAFSGPSFVPLGACLLAAVPLPAAVALFGDAARARLFLVDEGFVARLRETAHALRSRVFSLLPRYLLAALLQTALALGAALLAAAVVARPPAAFAAGLAGSLLLLAAASLARAWALAHIVDAVGPSFASAQPVAGLHGPRDVGYEPAPAREVRPDSSVGRAED